jgi:hypothetical protein
MNTLYYIEMYNEGCDQGMRMCISAASARIAELQAVNGMGGKPEEWEITHIQRICTTPDNVDIEI